MFPLSSADESEISLTSSSAAGLSVTSALDFLSAAKNPKFLQASRDKSFQFNICKRNTDQVPKRYVIVNKMVLKI